MAETYEQLLARLVEVRDPVLPPGRPLKEMDAAEARKSKVILFLLGAAIVAGAAYLFKGDHWIWGSIVGLVGLLFAAAAFGGTNRVGPCPFCGETMVIMLEEDREPRQCEKCRDYLVYDGKALRPLDPNTVKDAPTFAAPLFQDARWPKACVVCGEPPSRLDDTKGRALNAAMLVVGRVSVSSAEVTGIPYCDKHRDAVVAKVGQDRKVSVVFTSIRMMRRYMIANRAPQRPRA